jgi:hypothetical protein
MKTFALFAICLMAALSSCDDTERTYFTIKVDSIAAPESIRLGNSFSAKFYGMIGGSSCYQFNKVERQSQSAGEELKFQGVNTESPNTACLDVVMYLNDDDYYSNTGKTLQFTPKSKGIFTISIRQPDNSVLKRTIIVE